MRRKDAVCGLIWVVGLAAAAAVMLLWGASRGAPLHVAAALKGGSVPGSSGPGSHSLYRANVGGTWVSTTPVTTVLSSNGYQVWPISQYGVTITFYENSVPLDLGLFPELKDSVVPLQVTAIFTFTPQENVSLAQGLTSAYVFNLEGRYSWGGPVSMNNVDIALQYNEDDLEGIIEHTLRFYHYDSFARAWGVQPGSLDSSSNVIECTTDETGLFAVAGTRFQLFLPIAFKE